MISDDLFLAFAIAFTLICLVGFIYECLKDLGWVNRKKTPKVAYTALVSEIVLWTVPLLHARSVKKLPKVKVSYYINKNANGYYHSDKDLIEVFVNNPNNITDIVRTTLHEIKHHIQNHSNPDFDNYDEYAAKFPHSSNPFEIEAFAFADRYLKDCLKHLKSIDYI